MIYNRRTEIVEFLLNQFKLINGGISTFDTTYTYVSNLFGNAFRGIKFLDEINDFPTICLAAEAETRNFQSENLTVATLPVIIRAYVYGEDNSQSQVDSLVQDLEHVVYNIGDHPDMGILDITIQNITQDEGLAFPYGISEIELSVVYRLEY